MKSIYINVQGGTGLNFSLSHVLGEAKSIYDKIAVMSPYFDIFERNPNVDVVYKPNEGRDFIFDAKEDNAEIVTYRIYDLSDFIYKRMNYEDGWRKMLHLPERKNKGEPSSIGNDWITTNDIIDKYVDDIMDDIGDNEFIICQFNGGQSPLTQVPLGQDDKGNNFADWSKVPYDVNNEPLQRHYPIDKAQKFIDIFKERHPDVQIIYYGLPNEYKLNGVKQYQIPYIVYPVLAERARGIVAIDSSLQHACANRTKGVVVWGHSLPNAFGYECYENVIQKCRRDDILYMSLLGPSSAKITYIEPESLADKVDEVLFEENKDDKGSEDK